jgi:hypothetical protein
MEELHQRISAPSCSYSSTAGAHKRVIGGAGLCPLSGSFDTEDEDDGIAGNRIKAPNVKTSASKQHKSLKRVLIDSRNRDVALFPSASNFVQTLPTPIRAVKSVSLTDARIPVVDPASYLYCVVCLPDLSGGDLLNTKESSQFAPGALAVVPMIPTHTGDSHTYYQSYPGQKMGGSGGGWRLEFPMGITLSQIRVQTLVYATPPTPPGPIPGASTLLPIVDATPSTRSFVSNMYITLEIEHEV